MHQRNISLKIFLLWNFFDKYTLLALRTNKFVMKRMAGILLYPI